MKTENEKKTRSAYNSSCFKFRDALKAVILILR